MALASRYELMIAARYLTTRRKQAFITIITTISVIGVAVGVAALIIGLSLATGIHQEIRSRILGANAHVTVFAPPGSHGMRNYAEVEEKIRGVTGIVATAPVVFEKGLMISELNSSGTAVFLKGIDPDSEADVTDVAAAFIAGDLESLRWREEAATDPIALGKDLARSLGVDLGDKVKVIVPRVRLSPWGVQPRRRTFEVVGIVDSGFHDYDSTWAFAPREGVRRLLGDDDLATVIEVRLSDPDDVARARGRIASAIGDLYPVTDMIEMNRTFFAALRMEKLLTFLVIGLIVAVAALNIVSTLILMVMEKVRDIGTLMSMGATSRGIMTVFMAQGVLIGLAGTLAGCVVGVSAAWILDTYKVLPLPADVYFIPYVPFHVRPIDFTLVALTSLVVSFLATLYPAWKASRLHPVEALRYE